MQIQNWEFIGTDSLQEYKNPPLIRIFVEALLCGLHSLQLEGHRKKDAQSAINMICQLLIHNTLSTRQIITNQKFGKAIICIYKGSSKKVVVIKGIEACINDGFQLSESVKKT